VDVSPDVIAATNAQRDRQQIPNAGFTVADHEEFSAAEKFDCALFYDSLHHAGDERVALRCAFRSLREGGMLIAFEPGRRHSLQEASLRSGREFGVHEKDMPADYIAQLGREAGFTRILFCPGRATCSGTAANCRSSCSGVKQSSPRAVFPPPTVGTRMTPTPRSHIVRGARVKGPS